MKILIISDTHLGQQIEPKKLRLLERIIKEADRVIINGDFWDQYWTTFPEFINSDWKLLFPLLLEKQTVYLYGNHDPKQDETELNRFSVKQTRVYSFMLGQKMYRVEHGDRYFPPFRWWLRLLKISKRLTGGYIPTYFVTFAQYLYITCFGIRAYQKSIQRVNNIMRRKWKALDHTQQILICGHSHFPMIDFNNRYLNSGMIRFGHAQYILIEEQKAKLVETKY